jgi:hypothetical protein
MCFKIMRGLQEVHPRTKCDCTVPTSLWKVFRTSRLLHLYFLEHMRHYLSVYLWLYSPLLVFGRFFSFLIFYTVSRTPLTGD